MKLHRKIASKKGYGKENFYQDKVEIIPDELIIFKHPQKKKDVYYMRFYVGDKKYKILSLRTADLKTAKLKALEKWKSLSNHLEAGGDAFEISTKESLDQYRDHLEELVETKQIKRLTMTCKKTSLKKLELYLQQYDRPSLIPPNALDDYIKWRRTKNWDKSKHKNNPDPPTDQTINRELFDFKGYFDWMRRSKRYVQDIEFPILKIDWKKSEEKNPSFDVDDWMSIVYYMRTWVRKTENRKEFGIFYRIIFCEFLKVLANSGMRPHEALKLRWSDITLKKKEEITYRQVGVENDRSQDPVVRERMIAHIQISPDTKTGRRLVICPAGVYFRRIRNFYKDKTGSFPKPNDFIFHNIGTTHSKKMDFVGKAISTDHFRKLWYELIEDIKVDKDVEFQNHYTIYSCRSFFINQRLEMGVAPHIVAKLVGHSVATLTRHYENIQLKQLEPELVEVRKKRLEEADFQTYDLQLG